MKKIFIVLYFFISFQYWANAQNILSLQTATIGGATVITPTYRNFFNLMNATKGDFIATMTKLQYMQSKPDDPNTFKAINTDQVYNVEKGEGEIDIFFSDNGTYAKTMKNDLLMRYPRAIHKSMDKGVEAYYFDPAGSVHQYCMLFDFWDDGGGVTLMQVD